MLQDVEQGDDCKASIREWQLAGIAACEGVPNRPRLLTTQLRIDVQGGNVGTRIEIAHHATAAATYLENPSVCIDRSRRDPMNRPHLLAVEQPVRPTSWKRIAGQEAAKGCLDDHLVGRWTRARRHPGRSKYCNPASQPKTSCTSMARRSRRSCVTLWIAERTKSTGNCLAIRRRFPRSLKASYWAIRAET